MSITKIDQERWESILKKVVSDMVFHVPPFLTPIAKNKSFNLGELHGTGSFWEFNGKHYILTCEHVASEHEKNPKPGLSYLPDPNEQYIRCGCFISLPEPEDLAIFIGTKSPCNGKNSLNDGQLANDSDTVEGEVLFICGFPQKNSTPFPTQLNTRVQSYGCQKCPLPHHQRFQPDMHFAIRYPVTGVQSTDGEAVDLSDPYALSGSLVWSTEFVKSGCSPDWKPSQSKIIGVAWCWSKADECLVVTKVEVLRNFLLQALQKESTNEHWKVSCEPGKEPTEEDKNSLTID